MRTFELVVAFCTALLTACQSDPAPSPTSNAPTGVPTTSASAAVAAAPTASGAAPSTPRGTVSSSATAAPASAPSLDGFAGFSKDGKRFAWVTPAALDPDEFFLGTITEGSSEHQKKLLGIDADGLAKGKELLKKDGFSTDRHPPAPDLALETTLADTPPRLAVVRAGKRAAVDVGKYPYPPTDVAEIWGTSADGKHVAIHIHGKDVPGLLSKGNGGTFHFFFVAPAP